MYKSLTTFLLKSCVRTVSLATAGVFLLPGMAGENNGRWRVVGLVGGGSMFSIAGSPTEPRTMIVSSDMSGAFVTNDYGRSWRLIHHKYVRGNTTCPPCFLPNPPGTVLMPARYGSKVLMVSRDNGWTWRPRSGSPRSGSGRPWSVPSGPMPRWSKT